MSAITEGANGVNTGSAGNGGDSGNGGGAGQAAGGNAGAGGGNTAGGSNASWRDVLPAELKDNPVLSRFTDVGNLAKSYLHAQEAISKKGVIVPDWGKATPDQVKQFKSDIGVPGEDKYEVSNPQGFEFPKETMDWFKKTASKVGLLPNDANALLTEYAAFESGRNTALDNAKKEQVKQSIEGLKKEWGESYGRNLQKGLFAAKELMGGEFVQHIDKNGFGDDVHFIKLMTKVADMMGEDKLREGGMGDGKESPAEIEAKIGQIYSNAKANGLYDKNHPNHQAISDELAGLFKKKTGGR